MERRSFLAITAGLAIFPAGADSAGPDEVAAIKKRIVDWYKAFGNPRVDRTYYRSFMTDDYFLLEHGELLGVDGDMAMLGSLAPDHERTDNFDFRHVRVDKDHAYAVYFLVSQMKDSLKGARSRRWLESAVLRRESGQWRFAVLHSTRIEKTPA